MYFKTWFRERGPEFVFRRGASVLERYGLLTAKVARAVAACVGALAQLDAAPTLATPGVIVEKNPGFVRQVQAAGAEIAVHGYQHLELVNLSPIEAEHQILRAVETFERHGIKARGFRAPYLRCSDRMLDTLPDGLFDYSSNQPIWWNQLPEATPPKAQRFFDQLNGFYGGSSAEESICVPWRREKMIEIPVCLPDDMLLRDGMNLTTEQIARAWGSMLDRIYGRGELFTLLFHSELASICKEPIIMLVLKARAMHPKVWVARLGEVSDWWVEKQHFNIGLSQSEGQLHLKFNCSERATILVRDLEPVGVSLDWDGTYRQLMGQQLDVPAKPLPFIGIDGASPAVEVLRAQGYIVETGEMASSCAAYLDRAALVGLTNPVKLIDHVEKSRGPLVRYGRWPDGAKAALCVTGDLDALTLFDYASRVVRD